MQGNNCAVLLAAGEGKRMKWNRPKVLSQVLFKPMLQWVLDAVRSAGIDRVCAVTGFMHEETEKYISANAPGIKCALQREQLGTGHAVMSASTFISKNASEGNTLVLNGDAPFISSEMICGALKEHNKTGSSVTVISASIEDPTGYGRIVRDNNTNLLSAIVEQKDASPEELKINEINSGAFWFRTNDLLSVLKKINNNNKQGEYYLTDAVKILISENKRASAYKASSPYVALGANDCLQLNGLNRIARQNILKALMLSGVDIPCTDGVIIGPDVKIGSSVQILPGTVIKGKTIIGCNCTVGPDAVLDNCTVGDSVTLDSVRMSCTDVKPNAYIKPFSIYKAGKVI